MILKTFSNSSAILFPRISVIFHVRSAKPIRITDFDLLKRLGMIVGIFCVFLIIRTLVAPPLVITGKTAEDLKAYLCRTDWWDHSFTSRKLIFVNLYLVEVCLTFYWLIICICIILVEVLFLIWGIRLCIVVRKAPSEFNESRFISMAIYNEFLLTVFLKVSMWVYKLFNAFLVGRLWKTNQKQANLD